MQNGYVKGCRALHFPSQNVRHGTHHRYPSMPGNLLFTGIGIDNDVEEADAAFLEIILAFVEWRLI